MYIILLVQYLYSPGVEAPRAFSIGTYQPAHTLKSKRCLIAALPPPPLTPLLTLKTALMRSRNVGPHAHRRGKRANGRARWETTLRVVWERVEQTLNPDRREPSVTTFWVRLARP